MSDEKSERDVDALVAERDRLRKTIDALAEKAPQQRLLEAVFGSAGCRCGCGAPRWDEDKFVLANGWDTPDRCGRCGAAIDDFVAARVERAVKAARREALREAGQLVRDHVFGTVKAEKVADFLDQRAARLRGDA